MALVIETLGRHDADLVATVGRFQALPGAVNVVPGEVKFTLDARSPSDEKRNALTRDIETQCHAIAKKRGVTLKIEPMSSSKATPMADAFVAGLADAVSRRQIAPRLLSSGAGHDAMAMADLCSAGMLFVRCKGGISHNPAESMTAEDCDVALEVLLDFVVNFKR